MEEELADVLDCGGVELSASSMESQVQLLFDILLNGVMRENERLIGPYFRSECWKV